MAINNGKRAFQKKTYLKSNKHQAIIIINLRNEMRFLFALYLYYNIKNRVAFLEYLIIH
jgi:hypothetical protein